MTLAKLGSLTGYSAAQVSRLERGKSNMADLSVLQRFAQALGIPPQDLGLAPITGGHPDSVIGLLNPTFGNTCVNT
ncbi:helix-turn-helix domain-containing protein [Streptomyces subrutilus]